MEHLWPLNRIWKQKADKSLNIYDKNKTMQNVSSCGSKALINHDNYLWYRSQDSSTFCWKNSTTENNLLQSTLAWVYNVDFVLKNHHIPWRYLQTQTVSESRKVSLMTSNYHLNLKTTEMDTILHWYQNLLFYALRYCRVATRQDKKIPWQFSLTLTRNLKFPWLDAKFPDFSLTLKKKGFSLTVWNC